MANYHEIFFLGTQPSVDPPNRPKKVKKGVHATNKTADPTDIQIVIMGLIHLDIKKSKKIPKVGKQKQTDLANKQCNKNFPNTGKSKKNKASNTVECPAKTTPRKKGTSCKGPHSDLMFCPNQTQHLPSGRYQPTPGWPCCQSLSTKHWDAKNCNHKGKGSLCPRTKKSNYKAYKGSCIA